MGRAWVAHPSWEVVGEASEVAGRDIGRLLLDADLAELTLTANAQLATLVASLVVLDAVERLGLVPAACAGHSLGEYSALVASGCIALEEAIGLVAERGQAMHEAADGQPGAMAAVLGADDDAVDAACRRAEGDVWLANFNAPGQVVIAGAPEAVAAAGDLARELGARKVMPLPVEGAFHTPLMASARPRLRKALAATTFFDPDVPVVANVDARAHSRAAEWPGLLSAQLCSPVRWRQSLETLGARGVTCVAELGPGGVLTGLARRSLTGATAVAVTKPEDLEALVEAAAGTGTWHAYAAAHQGEMLYSAERVVVAPQAGEFHPVATFGVPGPEALAPVAGGGAGGASPRTGAAGAPVLAVGDLVGHVGTVEARTPFGGALVAFLAHDGERVSEGQPLAWLRVATEGDA